MTQVFALRKSLGYELYQNRAHLAWAHGLEVYPKHLFKSTILFALCFMMGEVHKWGDIPKMLGESIYGGRKVVCFVLFVLMRYIKPGCFRSYS
jgi:hypothetical protein